MVATRRHLVQSRVGVGAWMSATGVLATTGMLSGGSLVPPPAFLALLGGRIADTVPLAASVGVQAFRVPLEVLLHRLHLEQGLPEQMTYAGWNFDIVTGALAIALAGWLGVGSVPTGWVWASLSLPTPFQ